MYVWLYVIGLDISATEMLPVIWIINPKGYYIVNLISGSLSYFIFLL